MVENKYTVLAQTMINHMRKADQAMVISGQIMNEARQTLYKDKDKYGPNYESMDSHKALRQAKKDYLRALQDRKDAQDILFEGCLKYCQDMLRACIFNMDPDALSAFVSKLTR